MSNFCEPPHLELLQWLARGSLKQNLGRAIRLWLWLHYLYGEQTLELNLPDFFTFHDWRNCFFASAHPHQDQKPQCREPQCRCHYTNHYWLFESSLNEVVLSEREWCQQLQNHHGLSDKSLKKILVTPTFSMTRRSLQSDLHLLSELGWLKRQGKTYRKIHQFPSYPSSLSTSQNNPQNLSVFDHNLAWLNPDLQIPAQTLNHPLGGYQRFFLYVDYVVHRKDQDRVEDWQELLKQIWTQTPICPIKLTYHSAKYNNIIECITYPVSVYYVHRAIYLAAFGTTPSHQGQWYNYRLERIQNLQLLSWNHPQIPQFLLEHYQHQTLPTPDQIEIQLEQVWGFDFYETPQLMLLRFEHDFHELYIKNTHRHPTFKLITYPQAFKLIQSESSLTPLVHKQVLSILEYRSPYDAYYTALSRQDDINIRQRLRAWRPHAEVLLPWNLRQQMIDEIQQEMKFYL
jgi:CRISPR-associated protein (TIGR03985 family)